MAQLKSEPQAPANCDGPVTHPQVLHAGGGRATVTACTCILMRIPPRASATIPLALLLAGVLATLLASGLNRRASREPDLMAVAPPAVQGVMPCLYHVMIIYDVHWASACMKNDPPDDAADCTLPPERASVLNAAQREAEAFCERRGL